MRRRWMLAGKIALFFLLPLLSVAGCRLLRLAQGERNEEIVFGLLLGLLLDLLYGAVLAVWHWRKSRRE